MIIRALPGFDPGHSPSTTLLLAIHLCVFSVCRATQHGADMLGLLSKLLNENARAGARQNDMTALVVSLAVQGLQALCQEEVLSVCLSVCLSVYLSVCCLFVCLYQCRYVWKKGKHQSIVRTIEQSKNQEIQEIIETI